MTHAGQHLGRQKAKGHTVRISRTKMNASLAMVVCFAGFQGIVPQTWESASAVAPVIDRTVSGVPSDDALDPTGTVGSSLLVPLAGLDAINPLDAGRTAAGFPVGNRPGAAGVAVPVTPPARPAEGTLFGPLAALVPTSSFGFRTSPITGEAGEFHTGQDYAAPCGTAVYAADAGTVRAVGWHPWGGGNRVEVDHGNGLITSYNHLQGISVTAGDAVAGGDPIAALGTTGSSTGCHLHFETILNGEHVDPLRWKLVSTQHGGRMGDLKDYAPDAAGNSTLPVWAQSSTRSDQPAPGEEPAVSSPVPAAAETLAGGVPRPAPAPEVAPVGAVADKKPVPPRQEAVQVPPREGTTTVPRKPGGTPPVVPPPVVKPPVPPKEGGKPGVTTPVEPLPVPPKEGGKPGVTSPVEPLPVPPKEGGKPGVTPPVEPLPVVPTPEPGVVPGTGTPTPDVDPSCDTDSLPDDATSPDPAVSGTGEAAVAVPQADAAAPVAGESGSDAAPPTVVADGADGTDPATEGDVDTPAGTPAPDQAADGETEPSVCGEANDPEAASASVAAYSPAGAAASKEASAPEGLDAPATAVEPASGTAPESVPTVPTEG